MKYCLMELFRMHRSGSRYGVACSDRVELFAKAKQLGFDGVEFGLNHDYAQDPFWTGEGDLRQAMRQAALETGVDALSLCLHVLNDRQYSPASTEESHRATARGLLEKAMVACHEIGVSVILVPFFGTSTLRASSQTDHLVVEMRSYAVMAESLGIKLGLETSLDAAPNLSILERIASNSVRIYFDVANTAGIGYDVEQEILELGSRIVQVHIKEYPQSTVLGEGRIDFRRVSQALHQIGFNDCLVLELPTSDDTVMQANLAYIRRMIETPG